MAFVLLMFIYGKLTCNSVFSQYELFNEKHIEQYNRGKE